MARGNPHEGEIITLEQTEGTLGPTLARDRIAALDVLRGFALYGVFLTNAFVCARPFDEALAMPGSAASASAASAADLFSWGAFQGLLVMKFVALFSLLFGMGLVLQEARARDGGAHFARVYRRRLGALAVIGVLHGCLLFEGDILLPYALVGGLLFLARRAPARRLVAMGLVPLVIGIALMLAWAALGPEPGGGSDGFEERAAEIRRDGTLSELLAIRPIEYGGWLVISSLISFNWRIVALFFFGAAAMKASLLEARHAALQRRILFLAGGAGLGLELGSVALSTWPEPLMGARLAQTLASEIGSLLLSAGYAAGVVLAVRARLWSRLQAGLAAVGRTALSNYLAQSVIMNLVFMPFGLGLYEHLSRLAVLGWFSLLFLGQVLVSLAWMRRFPQGPIEWLWRRLTYPRPAG